MVYFLLKSGFDNTSKDTAIVIIIMLEHKQFLRRLDPVFLGGYHPTLKLSGIPTFTFIVSLTHRMHNI